MAANVTPTIITDDQLRLTRYGASYMKIKDIKAVKFKLPFPKYKTEVRRPAPTGLATD
tara:strand:- start:31 stop:204 length:174 start_codon:yes stop_codon:yes gene_type:complete